MIGDLLVHVTVLKAAGVVHGKVVGDTNVYPLAALQPSRRTLYPIRYYYVPLHIAL